MQADAATGEFSIVTGGPVYRFLARVMLTAPRALVVVRGAVLLGLIAWLPLLVLSIAGGLAIGTRVAIPFVRDVGAHTRFLLAVPLLLVADLVVGPRLAAVVGRFRRSGLIAPTDEPAFEDA